MSLLKGGCGGGIITGVVIVAIEDETGRMLTLVAIGRQRQKLSMIWNEKIIGQGNVGKYKEKEKNEK